MRLRSPVYCLLALGILTSGVSYAADKVVEYYRYTDERGITVISRQGIPANLIGNGYEVLSEQGRVLRVIPRAPTPEEYKKMQADQEQAKSDRQLLRLYTRIEDIDRARDRKIADIDGQISIARRPTCKDRRPAKSAPAVRCPLTCSNKLKRSWWMSSVYSGKSNAIWTAEKDLKPHLLGTNCA